MLAGITVVIGPAFGTGMYIKRHPQLVVRKIMAGMNRAPSRRY